MADTQYQAYQRIYDNTLTHLYELNKPYLLDTVMIDTDIPGMTKVYSRIGKLASVKKTRAVVVAEEHQINGGLGDAIAHVLTQNLPAPMEYVAVKDSFGESGKPLELLDKYGLSKKDILWAAKDVLDRKK